MRTTMLVLLICILTQTAGFGELTKQDLEAIQKVVKEEIFESEQRTGIKLAEINTEIKLVRKDIDAANQRIDAVNQRVDDVHRLVTGIFAMIAVIVVVATAMTYAAKQLSGAMTEHSKSRGAVEKMNELLEPNTKSREENNRLLAESIAQREELNTRIEELQAVLQSSEARFLELAEQVGIALRRDDAPAD